MGHRGPGLASESMGALEDGLWEPYGQGNLWPAAGDLKKIFSFMLYWTTCRTDPSLSNKLSPSVESHSGHLCFVVGEGCLCLFGSGVWI